MNNEKLVMNNEKLKKIKRDLSLSPSEPNTLRGGGWRWCAGGGEGVRWLVWCGPAATSRHHAAGAGRRTQVEAD